MLRMGMEGASTLTSHIFTVQLKAGTATRYCKGFCTVIELA